MITFIRTISRVYDKTIMKRLEQLASDPENIFLSGCVCLWWTVAVMREREEVLREKKTNREELKKLISEENTPKKQNKTARTLSVFANSLKDAQHSLLLHHLSHSFMITFAQKSVLCCAESDR